MTYHTETLHGHHHIPRRTILYRTPLRNEYGTTYGYELSRTWREDATVVMYFDPQKKSCGCDACRGLSTVWDQYRLL